MQRSFVVILAGGSGLRMGGTVPKQFLLLKGRPVLLRTVEVFERSHTRPEMLIVLPKGRMDEWKALCRTFNRDSLVCRLVPGGITRFHSVQQALQCIEGPGVVAVHDGVRPLITPAFVDRCFALAAEHPAVIPVNPVLTSVRRLTPDGKSQEVPREGLFHVQTPQVFDVDTLKRAYTQAYLPQFTDDATVVEKAGVPLFFTDSGPENIKITRPEDLAMAERLLCCCL